MCCFKAAAKHKPVEGHGNRLEVYPSGANPLNDILIAFCSFYEFLMAWRAFTYRPGLKSVSLSHHGGL